MKRVIKTAVAVTSFGLAAALAAPVHADVQDLGSKSVSSDEPGGLGGGLGGLLGPVSSLLGPVTGLLGGLGGKKAASAGEDEREYYGPNSYEDATPWSEPRPELAPRLAGLPLLGSVTKGLPGVGGAGGVGGIVPGASRMAAPADTHVKPSADSTLKGAFASVADLVEGSLGGAMAKLSTTNLVPGATTSAVDASNTTTDTLNGTTQGVENLSLETTMSGLGAAAKHALPHARRGELAPLIGHLAPAETAPLVETLPGATQVLNVEEMAPLVEDTANLIATNGTKATGSYNDTAASLGWATAALTSGVTESYN
jgi:hypothetical protein